MPGFDHLAALAAVPRCSRSTPCALAARPVIVNALSVALPYPLTALLTHLVVPPPLPASHAYRQSRQLTIPMPILQPCVLTVVTAVHAIPWLDHGLQPLHSRLPAGQTLPGCRAVPCGCSRSLGSATICLPSSVLEPTGDVAAAASGPGRWSPGCLRPPWRRPGSTAFKIVFSRAIL